MGRIISVAIAVVLGLSMVLPAAAEDMTSDVTQGLKVEFTDAPAMTQNYEEGDINDAVQRMQPGDSVTFTIELANNNTPNMVVNYTPDQINHAIGQMQPGDSVTFAIALANTNEAATDWYMDNKVLQSLERTAGASLAEGGAYTYQLRYTGPGGERDLFNSDTVGGDDSGRRAAEEAGEGMEQATNALDEYFYLDTLPSGGTARVMLTVALDGETQGNAYQDTLARLQMSFGVRLTEPTQRIRRFHTVRTGDEEQVLVWSVVMLVCGVLALALAMWQYRRSRKERRQHG